MAYKSNHVAALLKEFNASAYQANARIETRATSDIKTNQSLVSEAQNEEKSGKDIKRTRKI